MPDTLICFRRKVGRLDRFQPAFLFPKKYRNSRITPIALSAGIPIMDYMTVNKPFNESRNMTTSIKNFEPNIDPNCQNVLAYNGTFTIVNTDAGTYRTFKVHTVKNGKLQGKRIISLLSGPDNEADYIAFGFVHEMQGEYGVQVWRKHNGTQYDKLAQFINWIGVKKDMPIAIWSSKACRVCGRKLTTPESIESGIGPICESR